MKIIFMGTPDFAVASLKKLVENNCTIVAVITAPDRPAGRGQKVHESPVKQYATAAGLPVLQPEKLKNSEFLEILRSYKADLQIVVAFRMLPEVVWSMPPLGTFNLHGSLLPQYRGAAPINWEVINGEKETGVTTFFIEKEIDTGKIIFKETLPISEDATAGTMHDTLMEMGATLVLKTVRAIETGNFPQENQPSNEATLKPAPKINKENCEINWKKPSEAIRNFIRGLSPYPAAWTLLNGKTLKVFSANYVSKENYPSKNQEVTKEMTTFFSDKKTFLYAKTSDGFLAIETLQLEGKKRMTTEEFLRGYHFLNA